MHEGRETSLWEHTSSVLAHLHNINRSRRAKVATPDDYNPMAKRKRKRRPKDKGDIGWLKVFLPKRA